MRLPGGGEDSGQRWLSLATLHYVILSLATVLHKSLQDRAQWPDTAANRDGRVHYHPHENLQRLAGIP